MSDPNESEADEPKIIVDDDWKEQVAKERDAASDLASQDAVEASLPSEESAGSGVDAGGDDANSEMPAPPPASFEMLITMMFTQAMSMLGQIPDPTTGKAQVNKPFAKHYIDTLEMIGEKTKGNLTDEETKMHGEALHALRMAYVSTKAT